MSDPEQPRIDPLATFSIQRIREITNLSRDEVDALPHGVIQVDTEGVILAYNRAESKLARKAPEDVVGRNFFTEVAPCTNVREFAGRFRRGVERGELLEVFPFEFVFGKRRLGVLVTLYHEASSDRAWIFVRLDPSK